MATYNIKTPSRQDWQKMKTQAKVPTGAVSKISIGDRIADVHKTWSYATATKCVQALERLAKELALYKNGIRAKHPNFVPAIDAVLKNVNEDLGVMKDVLEAKAKYYSLFTDVDKIWASYKAGGGRPVTTKDIAAKLNAFRHEMFSFARVDDTWLKTFQQVSKAAQTLGENANPTVGQKKYMDDVMNMLKTRKV